MNHQTYKAKLAEVRANDDAREAMMQAAAKKAGVRLSSIRSMPGGSANYPSRDRAYMRMFEKAKANGWTT